MIEPVIQVERKIKRKGSHVPKKLSNILKLLSMTEKEKYQVKKVINMISGTV